MIPRLRQHRGVSSSAGKTVAASFAGFPGEDYRRFEAELTAAFLRVGRSGRYVLDGEGSAFEREFASFLGVREVIGLGSGTDALEVMLRALGIGVGHAVIIPALAPSAVACGVLRSGAEPVYADIDPAGFTVSPRAVEEILSGSQGVQVKAVIAVHLYGHPADWDGLSAAAEKYGVPLLEDCAQAHGAVWKGRMAGTLGRMAGFSFYPTKNLGALGDAGAVATNDPELAKRARWVREYGWRVRFVSDGRGINSRLDELQAAILRAKLPGLPSALRKRRALAGEYDSQLSRVDSIRPPAVRGDCSHAFHQYVVRSPCRDALMRHLQERGIPVAIHYPVPLHRQPAFRSEVRLPETEVAVKEILSLPVHPYLTREAIHEVCGTIAEFGNATARD